ncbi:MULTISPECIES: class II aldolase/adducin family protein [unclassified Nocardiopsis]|uniref:class II aldolase/adducin family protein n=1 Tax=unclassified Nocardiopsis TaxID=2649073 RepID=UPI0013578726|nr:MULTISPECIES: class II aldolase/adducin family protein [unclassified Nocardiopsis]
MSESTEGRKDSSQKKTAATLAAAARSLSLGGHDDFNQGQVSLRLPGRAHMFIKGAMKGFDECVPTDIVTTPLDPADEPDPLAPPELPLHQAIYKSRPDVNAIVHSHAPNGLIFGATDLPLRPVSHDGAYFQGRLPKFTETSNTVLNLETANLVAKALGDNPALLLRNHGSVVVGKTIQHAVVFAHMLERACKLQLAAEQLNVDYHWSGRGDVAKKRDFVHSDLSVRSYWTYCLSQVRRRWPEVNGWKRP